MLRYLSRSSLNSAMNIIFPLWVLEVTGNIWTGSISCNSDDRKELQSLGGLIQALSNCKTTGEFPMNAQPGFLLCLYSNLSRVRVSFICTECLREFFGNRVGTECKWGSTICRKKAVYDLESKCFGGAKGLFGKILR
jgi:hypothetical protein